MASKLLRAVILGPPGSGKGTVCQRIAQNFGLQHLSSGHFLRENIKADTGEQGARARAAVNRSRTLQLGRADEWAERGQVSSGQALFPRPRVAVQAATCRGACSRWAAAVRGQGRGALGGGGRCARLLSPPGSSCPGEKPVTASGGSEDQVAGDSELPSRPASCRHSRPLRCASGPSRAPHPSPVSPRPPRPPTCGSPPGCARRGEPVAQW